MRHRNFIFLHHFHQILHNFRNIDITHINRSIFCHQIIDIFIQLALIRLSTELAKCHHRFLDQTDVILCHTFDCIADLFPVTLGKSSHHSHIDPDNLSILDPHVSRMWIRMEKAILHHLFDEIIHIFRSDLIKIITIGQKRSLVIDSKTVNIFHHKNMRRNILTVEDRYFNKSHIFVLFCKFRHICSFRQEIHLLLSHSPQFT